MDEKNTIARLYNIKEAATILGIGIQTLYNWRHLRKGPAYLRIGGRVVRYSHEDLEKYLDNCRVEVGRAA